MAEKVTIMKLKVDLECEKCFKKVKKVLAKYPQIRDQKFDHKENFVYITVACCSPEKIRDKLCSKGGGSIRSIEILEPPKPKPAEPEKKKDGEKPKPAEPDKKKDGEKPKSAEPEKKKDAEKPKEKPKEAEKPKPAEPEKKKEGGGGGDKPKDKPPESKPKDKPSEPKPAIAAVKFPDPVHAYPPPIPPPMAVPVGMCVGPYYEGGPYVNGYGGPPVIYEGYYARPVYDSYGGSRPYYVNRCDQYFSEENQQGCTIM